MSIRLNVGLTFSFSSVSVEMDWKFALHEIRGEQQEFVFSGRNYCKYIVLVVSRIGIPTIIFFLPFLG